LLQPLIDRVAVYRAERNFSRSTGPKCPED
jgi:hypothetical protein